MKITNAGRGIHAREVKGIERLRDLPPSFYAFSNLDLVISPSQVREIDLILISNRRIFLIDLKDWYGTIASNDGHWYQNGVDRGPSPVRKISEVARNVGSRLNQFLTNQPGTRNLATPHVTAIVLFTQHASLKDISPTERDQIFHIDDFIKIVRDDKRDFQTFGPVNPEIVSRSLADPVWRSPLLSFFNAGPQSPFKPGKRRFQRFVPEETSTFEHPNGIYAEFNAFDESNRGNLGTLRLWDFTKCEVRFQTENGRQEIAGREQLVYHWLRDRSPTVETSLLTPKLDDPDRSVGYWEIFDRRKKLQRLSEFSRSGVQKLTPRERIDLAKQLLLSISEFHQADTAHLDLGGHSIWLELPTTVKISHLFASRFPEGRSLGLSRYQFLASVKTPEEHLGVDYGPLRRDVYLCGLAVHQLLFGMSPSGTPPEWCPSVDQSEEFERLHHWFSEALDLDPKRRFIDATTALTAFNRATANELNTHVALAELERHRWSVRSQSQLLKRYSVAGDMIKDDDRVEVWRSNSGDDAVVVKMWKQCAWGDTTREAPRIVSFLNRALAFKADRLPGTQVVKDVFWMGDSFAIIFQWIEGMDLGALKEMSPLRSSLDRVIALSYRLVECVVALHDQGICHGDIKPENVIVSATDDITLIDFFDFAPIQDGEVATTRYAPTIGGTFERDRFAVLEIVDEFCRLAAVPAEQLSELQNAIKRCRDDEPKLTTLIPILEALRKVQDTVSGGTPAQNATHISFCSRGCSVGPIESDEGLIFVGFRRTRSSTEPVLTLRGSRERVEVFLNELYRPVSARRSRIEQNRIQSLSRDEVLGIPCSLVLSRNDTTDLSPLIEILDLPEIAAKWRSLVNVPDSNWQKTEEVAAQTDWADEPAADTPSEDALENAVTAADGLPSEVDVPTLWRVLMDSENEFTIDASATSDSIFDSRNETHRVELAVESRSLDFNAEDSVLVERQTRKGWQRIGMLDTRLSKPDVVHIRTEFVRQSRDRSLVEEGDRLRFSSHFEVESRRRRTSAVDRALSGSFRARDLVSVFDPRTRSQPWVFPVIPDTELLSQYALNEDQMSAFRSLLCQRPAGLLQGPPGTGKTRFIAAFVHYCLTVGLARNVLLASQSHEAVNAAGEAIVSFLRAKDSVPSFLRIANSEENVSLPLRPFHSPKVEAGVKDRFRAEFRERILVAGRCLGVPESITEAVVYFHQTVIPVIERLRELSSHAHIDGQRLDSLIDTLRQHLSMLDLESLSITRVTEWAAVASTVRESLSAKWRTIHGVSADHVSRIFEVARIGDDFSSSVASSRRSFESFFAATRDVVAGTCVALGRSTLGLANTAFDLVVIDEAARCTASELLVPLQSARWVVLVGDQAQLQPHYEQEIVQMVADKTEFRVSEIVRSDFDRVFCSTYGDHAGARLRTQYRMLPSIGTVVSDVFYPDVKLIPGRVTPVIPVNVLPPLLSKELIWVDTSATGTAGFEDAMTDTGSRTNATEAFAIVRLLERLVSHTAFQRWIVEATLKSAAIGVICMYSAQRELVYRRLRNSAVADLLDTRIKVGTVDSYQGQENPIVILSLVRNNDRGPIINGEKSINQGFLSSANRVNVAASRAMDRLVVVGSHTRWPPGSAMHRLAESVSLQISGGNGELVDVRELD